MLAVSNGSTVAYKLLDSVKINWVRVHALSSSDTNVGTICFEWYGDRIPSVVHTMAYAPAIPAKRIFTPPESSLASYWSTNDDDGNETLFAIDPSDATVTLVLDLSIQFVFTGSQSTDTRTITDPAFTGMAYHKLPLATEEFTIVGLKSVT
jgi:hypothetical protein